MFLISLRAADVSSSPPLKRSTLQGSLWAAFCIRQTTMTLHWFPLFPVRLPLFLWFSKYLRYPRFQLTSMCPLLFLFLLERHLLLLKLCSTILLFCHCFPSPFRCFRADIILQVAVSLQLGSPISVFLIVFWFIFCLACSFMLFTNYLSPTKTHTWYSEQSTLVTIQTHRFRD